jgi:hypothetical protein
MMPIAFLLMFMLLDMVIEHGGMGRAGCSNGPETYSSSSGLLFKFRWISVQVPPEGCSHIPGYLFKFYRKYRSRIPKECSVRRVFN